MRDCLNRFRTSQVSGLISSPNSPFMHPLESCVRGDNAYKGLSAFIRVQWQKWGEHGKVTFVRFRQTRVTASQRYVFAAQQHWLLPAWSTVHCGRPIHVSLLTCQLSGLYAVFAQHVFTITFRVHKEESKRWHKDTEWLLSFQSALGWNSSLVLNNSYILCKSSTMHNIY